MTTSTTIAEAAAEGRMLDVNYDSKSYELAEHFMQHEPCRNDPALYEKNCDSLAHHIQQAVENWFLTPDESPTIEPPK